MSSGERCTYSNSFVSVGKRGHLLLHCFQFHPSSVHKLSFRSDSLQCRPYDKFFVWPVKMSDQIKFCGQCSWWVLGPP